MGRRGRPGDRNRPGGVTQGAPILPSPESFEALLRWRRDVRRFRTDPVPEHLVTRLLEAAHLAPSVGNSQPWRLIRVETAARRAAIRSNFERANAAAADIYDAPRRAAYQNLKLAGFDRAPVHLAIFCDADPAAGHGLGRQTAPETLAYSCAGFVTVLWLAARTHGVGLGWVSILDPADLPTILDAPPGWHFIGYVLLGYPEEEHLDPELVRAGWQPTGILDKRMIIR